MPGARRRHLDAAPRGAPRPRPGRRAAPRRRRATWSKRSEHVGDDEPAHGQPGPGVRKRHGRLELGDPVVADVADDRLAAVLAPRGRRAAASRSRRASSARAVPGRPTRAGSSPRRARAGGGRPRAGSGGRCGWSRVMSVASVGKKKDPCGSSRSSGGGLSCAVQAHAPAPLARQDHQLVCGEGVIATTIGAPA